MPVAGYPWFLINLGTRSQRQILITTQSKIAGGPEKEVNPDTFNKGVTQALWLSKQLTN